MSRSYDGSVNQYDTLTAWAGPTAPPLTLFSWFNLDPGFTNTQCSILANYPTGTNQGLRLGITTGTLKVRVQAQDASATANTDTTTAITTGVWNTACGVFAATNSRAVYLNGGGKNTSTTDRTPSASNRLGIGRNSGGATGTMMDGLLAHMAVWNEALTDDEVAVLAAGASPLYVRPWALYFYSPAVRSGDSAVRDIRSAESVTSTGMATSIDEPPVLMPRRRSRLFLPASAAAPDYPAASRIERVTALQMGAP